MNPAVTGAFIGVRSAEQVSGIAGAADLYLRPGEIQEISQGDGRRLKGTCFPSSLFFVYIRDA
jgi:hypothetical protein